MWKDGMFTTQKSRTRRCPEISLSAQWRSDLISSSQGSLPLPAMDSRKQECGSRSPSSRMHVLFHSCCVAWKLRNEYLRFSFDCHVCSSAAAFVQSSVNFLSEAQQDRNRFIDIESFTVGEYNHSSCLGLAQIVLEAANGVTVQVAPVKGGHNKKGRRLFFHCLPTVSSLPVLLWRPNITIRTRQRDWTNQFKGEVKASSFFHLFHVSPLKPSCSLNTLNTSVSMSLFWVSVGT